MSVVFVAKRHLAFTDALFKSMGLFFGFSVIFLLHVRYAQSLRREPDASIVASRANFRMQKLVDKVLREKHQAEYERRRLLGGMQEI